MIGDLYNNTIAYKVSLLPVRLHTRGRVIFPSVHPWVCGFVCLFEDTKMSTLSEVGKHVM